MLQWADWRHRTRAARILIRARTRKKIAPSTLGSRRVDADLDVFLFEEVLLQLQMFEDGVASGSPGAA
ncbi:hypothetical protein CSE45_2590 [Citreicella sp. SE45]|nr:hypothetical protein CSE45_2590 [Citreicella sp. SE45]